MVCNYMVSSYNHNIVSYKKMFLLINTNLIMGKKLYIYIQDVARKYILRLQKENLEKGKTRT